MRLKIATTLLLLLSVNSRAWAQRWERLGPEGGMVVSLGTTRGSDVYLGTGDGHIFASKDGARSWQLRGRVGNRLDAVVTRLVVDPRELKQVYAAVWFREAGAGGGVFRSEDEGRSWELLGLKGEEVRALEIAPSRPGELVAGTRSGVFRTTDQGKSWVQVSPAGDEELRNVDSLAIDPRDPDIIFAGTYHLPWVTRDGGKNWKADAEGIIDDSDIMSLLVDEGSPERLYMSACSGIYRSENRGASWTKLQGIPYAARRTQVIVQDPGRPGTLYAGTTEGLWVTRDGGENWTRTTSKDWVVNSVVVLAEKGGGSGRVVLGTEGQGIQVSDDMGMSFNESNRGFTHVVVKQLLADYHTPGHFLMIAEQNGPELLESGDAGQSWVPISLASTEPGARKTLKIGSPEEVYSSPWGWLVRSGNGQCWRWEEQTRTWKEWGLLFPMAKSRATSGGPGEPRKSERLRRISAGPVMAFSRNDAIVSTAEGPLRCMESGICRRLKAYGQGTAAHVGWMSPSGREIGLAAYGKLGWSSDGGETAKWHDLPVPNESAFWLDAAESGAHSTVYLGTASGLYLSQDSGVHWQRTKNGLPAGQVDQWLRGSGIWALTEGDGGMYISHDEGSTWERVDEDSERGRFTGLVRTGSGAMLAGSQSEGLLRMEIPGEQRVPGGE